MRILCSDSDRIPVRMSMAGHDGRPAPPEKRRRLDRFGRLLIFQSESDEDWRRTLLDQQLHSNAEKIRSHRKQIKQKEMRVADACKIYK